FLSGQLDLVVPVLSPVRVEPRKIQTRSGPPVHAMVWRFPRVLAPFGPGELFPWTRYRLGRRPFRGRQEPLESDQVTAREARVGREGDELGDQDVGAGKVPVGRCEQRLQLG